MSLSQSEGPYGQYAQLKVRLEDFEDTDIPPYMMESSIYRSVVVKFIFYT